MKKILFPILSLIILACTPQVTVPSEMTVTLPVVETPIPTATVNPQFQSLQQQIATSQNYTLTQNGDFEFQTEEGVIFIPDIKVSKVNGEIIFTENEEEFELELKSVDIEIDQITFIDKDGNIFILDGEELKHEPQLSPETQAKFDQAGIDLKDMSNVIFDTNGMHITLPDETVVDITTDELKANTFNGIKDNAIRIIDTTNKDGVFVINQDQNGKWVVEKLTFTTVNNIEFYETLSKYELSLAPDADKKAIYWDIAISHLGDVISKSEGMEFNRKVYEEILKDHPEWEGIGNSADYKVRLAFMQEFLTRTGGLMNVSNHNYEKFEADFNLPIGFEVIQVDKLPQGYLNYLGRVTDGSSGGGGSLYVNKNGNLIYSVAIAPEGIESTQVDKTYQGVSIFYSWKWTPGEVISEVFRKTIAQIAFKDRDSNNHNYKLYTRGGTLKSGRYYADVNWTFIK